MIMPAAVFAATDVVGIDAIAACASPFSLGMRPLERWLVSQRGRG